MAFIKLVKYDQGDLRTVSDSDSIKLKYVEVDSSNLFLAFDPYIITPAEESQAQSLGFLDISIFLDANNIALTEEELPKLNMYINGIRYLSGVMTNHDAWEPIKSGGTPPLIERLRVHKDLVEEGNEISCYLIR